MVKIAALLIAIGLASGIATAGGPLRARSDLARHLEISEAEVVLARVLLVEFTDECLGLRDLGISSCSDRLPLIPTGNVTWLTVGNQAWRYHGSEEFRALFRVEGPFPAGQVADAPIPAGVRVLLTQLPSTGSGGLADESAPRNWVPLLAAMASTAIVVGALMIRRVRS